MGRIIAIDYGLKRTGIAVSDPLGRIAGGLATLPSGETVAFLKRYSETEKVDTFVVGHPKQMNNQPSENMRHVEAFINRLRKVIPAIGIELFDERFTSLLAHRAMIDGGLSRKRRQNRALVDEISATLILQDYLESKTLTRL
ncbi:MAG: Holliday junction resolvase RuvX [Tannerella sp.]|jgi:putative Holliday junction resolvase|nr:Holliday junction resolvase RuvX [Tannerella sp.]